MAKKKQTLFLIDGTALIYRSFYAFIRNPLRDRRGNNTSAVFGVANTIFKFINQMNPQKMIISFDLKKPTFRHQLDEQYKATRPPAPDELVHQIEPVKEFFRLLNIPEIVFEGYEADDVIATLSEKFKDEYDIVIVAGDKDFSQIVEENVSLFDPFAEKVFREDDITAKYGVTPKQFVDYLAITGDTADNIPGIKGIGKKGASSLLQQYDSLDSIYEHLDDISSPAMKKKLVEGKESAKLSKELVTLIKEVPIEERYDVEKMVSEMDFTPAEFKNLFPYLKTYELNALYKKIESLLKELEQQGLKDNQESKTSSSKQSIQANKQQTLDDFFSYAEEDERHTVADDDKKATISTSQQFSFDFFDEPLQYELIVLDNIEKFISFFTKLKSANKIAIDFLLLSNKPSLEQQSKQTLAISICIETDTVYYLNLDSDTLKMLNNDELPTELQDSLQLNFKTIAIHNYKKLYHLLTYHLQNIFLPSTTTLFSPLMNLFESFGFRGQVLLNSADPSKVFLFDTMIASYLLDAHNPRHSLQSCVEKVLNLSYKTAKDYGIEEVTSDAHLFPTPVSHTGQRANVEAYLTQNAFFIRHLVEEQKFRLVYVGLDKLFGIVETPLAQVLADMEACGVYIEKEIFGDINSVISEEIDTLTSQIHALASTEFNINSPQQLSKVLFEDMKIVPVKKTKTGYSTDNTVLEKLSLDYEIADKLISYRQLTKLRSTYVEALPNLVNPITGRIHSTFNQTVTTTGRLSSSNPNLQNIPIRSEAGKHIRKAFKPEPIAKDDESKRSKKVILSADYSQIELRILGMMSKDENLVSAFNNKQDIHAQTAGLIFAKPIGTVSQDERRIAKTINFGIIYGMGATKLSKEIGVSQKEAKEFIEEYFKKFPKINDYINSQIALAKKKGYAETIFGRRLLLPNILSSSPRYLSEAERVAVNMPIQGSAADIIKLAMINIYRKLKIINSEFAKDNDFVARMIIQVHDELVFEVSERYLSEIKEMVRWEMCNALPYRYGRIIPLEVEIGTGESWFEAHE